MAEEVGNIVVKVDLDGTGFQNGVSALNRQMKVVQSEFQAASADLKGFGSATDQLKLRADSLTRQMDIQRQKIDALQRAHAQSAEAKGRDAKATQELEVKLNKAKAQLSQMGNELNKVNDQIQKQSSVWNKMSDSFQGAGQRMQDVGSQIAQPFAVAATAIGGALGLAVNKAMDFGAQMSRVGAIAGASSADLEALKETALELGASTSKSATEVAQGMEMMAAKGYDAQQVIAAMPGVIAAAEASGEDMALVADTVSSALNAFQLNASQSTHVADVLAMAANRSAAGVEDMQYAFKYAAPVAKQLGISLEQLAAATGIMSNSGIKGEQAGTTLRAALLRLADPPKEAANQLMDLGIKIEDAKGNMLPFSDIIGQVGKATSGMGSATKAAALSAIFGTEAVSGMLALIEAGPAKIDEFSKALENSNGASAKAAQEMKDNLAGALQELQGSFETAQISIGNALTPAIQAIAAVIKQIIDGFNQLSPAMQSFLAIGTAISGALMGLIAVLGFAAAGIGSFITAFGTIAEVIGSAGGAMGVLRTVFSAVTGPIGLAVGAIVTLGTAIVGAWKNSEVFRTAVANGWKQIFSTIRNALAPIGPVFDQLKGAFGSLMYAITGGAATTDGAFKKIGDTLGAFINSSLGTILPVIKTAFEGISTIVVSVVNTVIEAFNGLAQFWIAYGPTISSYVSNAFNFVKTTIMQALGAIVPFVSAKLQEMKVFWDQNGTQIMQAVSNVWNAIVSVISGAMTVLGPILSIAWAGIKVIIQSVWESIKGVISGAMNVIHGLIKVFSGVFTGDWSKAWEGVKQATVGAVQFLWNAIQLSLFGKVLSAAKVFVSGFKAAITAGWTSVKSVFTSSISAVQGAVTRGWNMINSISNTIMNAVKATLSSIWKGISSFVTSAVNGMRNAVTAAWNSIRNSVINAAKSVWQAVTTQFKAMKDAVSSTMKEVKTTIENIWKNVVAFFKGANLVSVGRDIIQGLITGIMGKAGELYNKAKEIANNIETTVRKALDTHSPSRKMQKVGHDVGDGLKKGLKEKEKEVKKSSQTLGEKILEGMKEATDKLETQLSVLKAKFEIGEIINAKNPKALLDFELKNLNEQFKIQQDVVNRTKAAYDKLSGSKNVLAKDMAEAAQKYATEAKSLSELADKISDVRLAIASNSDATARARERIEELNAEHEREMANLDENAGKMAELELHRKQTIEDIAAQKDLVAQLNRKYLASVDVKGKDDEATRKARMAYKDAQTEQAKLEKELRNTNKAIIEQKEELAAANKKAQTEADKTNAKLREQQEEIRETVAKVGELADKYRNDLTKAQEEYQRKVADTNQKLLDDERKVTEQYENELESRAKALRDFTGLFDEVQTKDVSGQQLLDNLKGQVDTFTDWQKNMDSLSGRGIDEELLKELRHMGPKAAGEIAALNSLSDAELTQYVSLWREKNRLAKNEATVQLQETKQEMYSKLAELRVQAAQQLQQYADEWKKKNEEITKNTTDELKKMVEEAAKKGEEMVTRMAEAITKSLPGLQSAFAGMPGFPAMGTPDTGTVQQAQQQAAGVIQAHKDQQTAVVQTTQQMTQSVLSTWQQAGALMSGQQDQIRVQTVTVWQSIQQQLTMLWNKMLTDMKKIWTEKQKFLFEVLKQVETRFNGLVAAASNWGINLMDNFISAVQSQFGRLHEVMFNMTQIVDSYMPHSPAKVGPLSTLDEWGPGMIGAFVDGIQTSMPDLERMMNQVAAVSTISRPENGLGLMASGSRTTTNHYGGNTIQFNMPPGTPHETMDFVMRELYRLGVVPR
ncbi:phage tail tape measure protein [Aneurinibacillus sp. BA2021]|nr:phage tail tape measure protein [Aneurinibacillus sp. BA2021]